MGVDIHIYVIDKFGKKKTDNLYDGRNYRWFDDLQDRGMDPEYNYLPRLYWNDTPREIFNLFKDREKDDYYGMTAIRISDLIRWYNQYRPHVHAGWVTKYDAWLYRAKGIVPGEDDVYTDPSIIEDFNIDLYEFIEYTDDYNPMTIIYNKITDNTLIANDDYLIFYFDC